MKRSNEPPLRRSIFATPLKCFVVLILLVILLNVVPDFLEKREHSNVAQTRLDKIQKYNIFDDRYINFRQGKENEYNNQLHENFVDRKETYIIYEQLKTSKLLRSQLVRQCIHKTDIEKLSDASCRAEWLYHLENAKIVSIIDMLGFVEGKTSAISLLFDDGRKAMFKPCANKGEYPENEVISSHLDYLLGFNRVAPVISRNISLSDLEALVLAQSSSLLNSLDSWLVIISQLRSTCAVDDVLYGSIIGWWRGVHNTITLPKKKYYWDALPDYAQLRKQFHPSYLAEITRNHFFFYLIGTLRSPGYNEYALEDGTIIALDLDRSTWNSYRSTNEYGLSSCYFCKIFQSDYEKLLRSRDDILGAALSYTLLFDPNQFTFPSEKIRVLDKRITSLCNCISHCLSIYPLDDVIISE